jgi:ABC-2 type transport system ATP-binding protein
MIKVQNLKKAFGPKIAVNDVSFTVEKGEVLGFLGPNGAGKSTTMRMVTGFIPPDQGSVFIGGFNMIEEPIKAKRILGYLPENAPLYSDMTVYGYLNFAAELRGLSGEAKKKAINRVIDLCFLDKVVNQSTDTLSKGYKHRTCFAQAILHDPDYLVMDEPTDGLDPNQKHEVREIIKRMGTNKAIIFSTHILEEVEAVCSRAIIIDRGKIVADGTPEQLKERSNIAGAVTIKISGVTGAEAKERLAQIQSAQKVVLIDEKPSLVTIRVHPRPGLANGELSRTVFELAVQSGWKLDELKTEEGRLDEVFRSITLSEISQEETK